MYKFLSSFTAYSDIYISFLLLAHVDILMIVFICTCQSPNVQWEFCLPFSWCKYSNQSHYKFNLNFKMITPLFGLPCWSLAIQNVDIHNAGVLKIPGDVFPCFDWEAANIIFHAYLIMNIYTIHISVYSWIFYGRFTWIMLWPNLLSVWTTFLGIK